MPKMVNPPIRIINREKLSDHRDGAVQGVSGIVRCGFRKLKSLENHFDELLNEFPESLDDIGAPYQLPLSI